MIIDPIVCASHHCTYSFKISICLRTSENNTFSEKNTNITYQLHDVVTLSNNASVEAPCFQFFDIALYAQPPRDPTQHEYEPIAKFVLDENYIINYSNAPTRPPARICRINMLMAKRTFNLSVDPMPISQALRHQYATNLWLHFRIKSLR